MLEELIALGESVLKLSKLLEESAIAPLIKNLGVIHQLLWEAPPDEEERQANLPKEWRQDHGSINCRICSNVLFSLL